MFLLRLDAQQGDGDVASEADGDVAAGFVAAGVVEAGDVVEVVAEGFVFDGQGLAGAFAEDDGGFGIGRIGGVS